MEAFLILFVGAMNVLCFLVGANVGQKSAKGEEIKLPSVNPIEVIRESQHKREAQKEQDRIDVILRNIEGYDGTSNGQEDVPRG